MGLGVLGNYYMLGGEMKEGFDKIDKRFENLEFRERERDRQLHLVKDMFVKCASKK